MADLRSSCLTCALFLTGCASHHPRPLVPRESVAEVAEVEAHLPRSEVVPLFDAEPIIRVLIAQTTEALSVSGHGLRVDGEPSAGVVRVELREGLLRSTSDLCSGSRCVLTAPGGIHLAGTGTFVGPVALRVADGAMLAVLSLPLEAYLYGVVSAEVPASWGIEVKRAQAIAARSYALTQLDREAPFDVTSDTLDQVYRARNNPGAVEAVNTTRGQVLIWEGDIVSAFYHSTCGGHTEDPADVWPDAPPFRWATTCATCANAPRFRWEARLRAGAVAAAHESLARVDELRVLAAMASGRAQSIVLIEGRTSVTMPAPEFRRAIGTTIIRSALFQAESRNGAFHFAGRGFGHGVGMCQWGAHGLAEQGHDHREVLDHYYGGTQVHRVYQ